MGATSTKPVKHEGRARVTLFYASFQEDVTWQAFADFVSPTVELSMVDVARHPDAALAEGVEIMPALVCVDKRGVAIAFQPPDDLLAEYGQWMAAHADG